MGDRVNQAVAPQRAGRNELISRRHGVHGDERTDFASEFFEQKDTKLAKTQHLDWGLIPATISGHHQMNHFQFQSSEPQALRALRVLLFKTSSRKSC